jgi:hypothetical protein
MRWGDDRDLHVYIYDYCKKRNFSKTAAVFLEEVKPNIKDGVPIDTPHGMIFEWVP